MLKTMTILANAAGSVANGAVVYQEAGEHSEGGYTWSGTPTRVNSNYMPVGINNITDPLVAMLIYRGYLNFSVPKINGKIISANLCLWGGPAAGDTSLTAKRIYSVTDPWSDIYYLIAYGDTYSDLTEVISSSPFQVPLNDYAISVLQLPYPQDFSLGLQAYNESMGTNYAEFFGIESGNVYKPYLEIIYEELHPGVAYSGGAGFVF